MSKRNNIIVACCCFLVGLILSSFLLRFLFGTSIYSRSNYYGLLAPSFAYLRLAIHLVGERILSYLIDALIFGSLMYVVIYAAVWLSRKEKYPYVAA